MINLITAFDRAIEAAKKADTLDLSNTTTPWWRKLSESLISWLMQQKEKYNLWVLNWPDLDLLARELPQPWVWAAFRWKDAFVNAYIDARNRAIQDFNAVNWSSYWLTINKWLLWQYTSWSSWSKSTTTQTKTTQPKAQAVPWVQRRRQPK